MPPVDRARWESNLEKFLAGRRVSPNTVRAYRNDLKALLGWCEDQSLDPRDMTLADYQLHFHYRRQIRSKSTVNRQEGLLKRYFSWLRKSGEIVNNPLDDHHYTQRDFQFRDTLSVDQIRQIIVAAESPLDYVAATLLAISAIRTDDLANFRVEDFKKHQGHDVLINRKRQQRGVSSFTPVTPETASALREVIGKRRSGPLLLNRSGDPFNRRHAMAIVERLARKAGFHDRVTPITLSSSMRPIAVAYGFSYAAVISSAGEANVRTLNSWVEYMNIPFEENAVFRMAELVAMRPEWAQRFDRAEALLSDGKNPPAVSAALVGAALESFLRDFSADRQVNVGDPRKAKLSTG